MITIKILKRLAIAKQELLKESEPVEMKLKKAELDKQQVMLIFFLL